VLIKAANEFSWFGPNNFGNALTVVVPPGVSHVTGCNFSIPSVPDETITIVKQWYDEDGELTEVSSELTAEITIDFEGDKADKVVHVNDTKTVDVPADATFTVDETASPAGWTEITCPQIIETATKTAPEPQETFTFCNQEDGDEGNGDKTITIIKQWYDEDGELTEVSSELTAEITIDFDDDTLEDIVVDVNNTKTVDVPADATFTVDETASPAGWTEIDCPADDSRNGYDTVPQQLREIREAFTFCNQEEDDTVTIISTPRTGEVTVEKVVVGDVDDVPADAEFSFTLECGTSVNEEFTLVDGGSETVTGIAANSDCTVTETEFGDAVGTSWVITGDAEGAGDGDVTDQFTVGSNDEVTVTFTNEFASVLEEVEVAPDISIVKSAVDGVRVADDGTLEVVFGPGTSSKSVTYEFVITNIGEDDLTELTLMDDKIGDLSEAFRGAVITEYGVAVLPVGGAVTVTAIHDVTLDDFEDDTLTNVATVTGIGVESEATVTDNDDETVVSIEVLGQIETEEPTVTPVVDTTETVAAEQLPRTGFDTGTLTSLGLLLAAIGAGVLLLGRRREEGDVS
jgi:LPXTG-motif cell wall-anchored protein